MDKHIIMKPVQEDKYWNVALDGVFKSTVTSQLMRDGMTSESIDGLFMNAVDILSECPLPNADASASTGIVIGKVQSGKTSNFISLMALALDNGYEICIVLGGNKTNLLEQNQTRIESYFQMDLDLRSILATSTNKNSGNKSLLNADAIKGFLSNNKKIIIVGLKHTKHIEQIREIFAQDITLSNVPTIIIDDEGDQATLNTKAAKNERSATYNAIINLKQTLKKHCFISVTATPQANMLIEAIDALSPDFGRLIYPGKGYCGLQEFHGIDQDKYIKVIPATDAENIFSVNEMPRTLYNALATFYMGGAIRSYRGDRSHHAMLVHPSSRKVEHQIVVKKLDNIIKKWKSVAEMMLEGKRDLSYKSIRNYLMEAYEMFRADGVGLPDFTELEMVALEIIKKGSNAHICNSEEDASKNAEQYKYNVFVGGNMVERGITIKGLAVTYIIRRAQGASNLDNTEQRARWFGYKSKFLDVCRVFTTNVIKKDFASILEHEEDLWDSIERSQVMGLPFKEIPRIFKLSTATALRLTRTNVAQTERYAFSEWSRQNKYVNDEKICKLNQDKVMEYFASYAKQVALLEFSGYSPHKVLRERDFLTLFDELLSKINYGNSTTVSNEFFNKIKAALVVSKFAPKVDILLMRGGQTDRRQIYEDGTINQLFRGSTSNYPGDRQMANHISLNNMQLQIHSIAPTDKGVGEHSSITFALYIPTSIAAELCKYVGRAKK